MSMCHHDLHVPVSVALGDAPRISLAIGEDPLGLWPREGDDPLGPGLDPLGVGDEPLGGLFPLGWVLAVGRVEVTVASSAEGSGTDTNRAGEKTWVGCRKAPPRPFTIRCSGSCGCHPEIADWPLVDALSPDRRRLCSSATSSADVTDVLELA